MTAYVLFLKLFKDCSDISIFWQEKTTCYFKKSSCYDALFTDCRTFRDRLDKRGRYKVRISEVERHGRHGASMRDILKFTPRTPHTPRCLACYQTNKRLSFLCVSSKIELLKLPAVFYGVSQDFRQVMGPDDGAWRREVTSSHRHFKLCDRIPESYRITRNLLSEYGKLNWEPSR